MRSTRLIAVALLVLALAGAGLAQSGAGPAAGDPAKLKDKLLAFPAQDAPMPWKKVLHWLSEQAELPFVGDSVPPGTFTFAPPKSSAGSRTYTLAEVIDIL